MRPVPQVSPVWVRKISSLRWRGTGDNGDRFGTLPPCGSFATRRATLGSRTCTRRELGPTPVEEDELAFNGTRTFDRNQDVLNNRDVFRLEPAPSHRRSKCPELLANCCDLLLRKSQLTKRLTSDVIDEKLTDVLLVLKYANNKDVFARYHKTDAREPPTDSRAGGGPEKEVNLVNKFKEAGMPTDYVNKLFRMLHHIEANQNLSLTVKKAIGANTPPNMAHPERRCLATQPREGQVSLPRELEEIVPEVEDFNGKQHSGLKLSRLRSWSTRTILANKMGKSDLEMTTFQTAASSDGTTGSWIAPPRRQ